MTTPKILLQFDSDAKPSVFDAVVAIDSEVDHLLQYGQVELSQVRSLVHGAMFTRGPDQLKSTAVFIGGSDAAAGEALAAEVRKAFFGPIRVSVMLDGNGSNTTAAAAVLSAARHVNLAETRALVLGGTGPVGQRAVRLLLGQGAKVWLASRDRHRAQAACDVVTATIGEQVSSKLEAVGSADPDAIRDALAAATVVISCGAAGIQLISAEELASAGQLQVAIDLNAVPPAGIEGIGAMDKAVRRGDRADYGAIGVGGLKMKIHRAAIKQLFTRNDLFLDAEQIYAIGQELETAR